MAAVSATNIQVSKNGRDFVKADYVGTSLDSKPTTGVLTGSTYLEAVYDSNGFAGKWRIYIFIGRDMAWCPFAEWDAPTVA